MKKAANIIILASLTAFSVLSCQTEKFTEKGIPEVKTTGVTVLDDGVTFYAEILSDGGQTIINQGFSWTSSSNPLPEEAEYVLLGPPGGTDMFSVTINNSIVKDEVYNLRAFILTESTTSYGNILTFTGKGSRPSWMESVTPAAAVPGDTVLITGGYFSFNISSCSVFFGGSPGRVISCTTNELKVIVPASLQTNVSIRVAISGIISSNSLDFNIIEPVLLGFSPQSGTFGDIITLSGNNFSLDRSIFEVYFQNVKAEVTELSRTGCKVRVPAGNNISPATISVRQARNYIFPDRFILNQAVISDVSPVVITKDETIVITGQNFNPDPMMNLVEIGGQKATVISCSATSISAEIPAILFNGIYQIQVTILYGTPLLWSGSIEVKNAWKRLGDFPGQKRVGATSFVINGMAYFGTGIKTDLYASQDFWVYDPESDQWTGLSNFPLQLGYVTGFSINGKGYGTLGKSSSVYNASLWGYNPENNSWQALAPFPGSGSTMDSPGFVINGKAYVPSAGSMYEYDPSANSWSQKAYPSELGYFGGGAAFAINGKGYLGVGWVHDESRDVGTLFEYNPSVNSWTRKADFPGTLRDNSISFSLPNGKGYVGLGYSQAQSIYLKDMWEYDPVSDNWRQLEDFPSTARFGAEVFVIGNNAYIGTGGAAMIFFSDFWRFSP